MNFNAKTDQIAFAKQIHQIPSPEATSIRSLNRETPSFVYKCDR